MCAGSGLPLLTAKVSDELLPRKKRGWGGAPPSLD